MLVLRQMWVMLPQTGSLKNTDCIKTQLELSLRIALTLLVPDFSPSTNYFEGRAVRAPEGILVSVVCQVLCLPLCPCIHKFVIDKQNISSGLITLFWLLRGKNYVASVKRMLLRKLVQTSYIFGRLLGQNITRAVGKGAEYRSFSRDN